MKAFKTNIKIKELPLRLTARKNGSPAFELSASDGRAEISLWYDFCERPLKLSARVGTGDEVALILRAHRIELYVGGELCDEEWPAGNCLFGPDCEIGGELEVEFSEISEAEEKKPEVISSFEGAEGWRPAENVFVGDCMPYERDGEYHVLYLKDRRHHGSKWGLGAHQWEHISTRDLKTWRVHPTAIGITDACEGSICTGSHIRIGDREYLYYTVRRVDGSPAPILRCVSDDGYHFKRDGALGFYLSDKYDSANARDPKVFLGEDGLYHMLLTTKLKKDGRGCLAHCVSRDAEIWEELSEPFYVAPDTHSPECPDYFKYKGKYYLVFSLRGVGHYMLSDEPFENFSMPSEPTIPCGCVPKCAEWQGRLVFAGFRGIDGYAGNMTFLCAEANERGELFAVREIKNEEK